MKLRNSPTSRFLSQHSAKLRVELHPSLVFEAPAVLIDIPRVSPTPKQPPVSLERVEDTQFLPPKNKKEFLSEAAEPEEKDEELLGEGGE